jgi:hypothetical protein
MGVVAKDDGQAAADCIRRLMAYNLREFGVFKRGSGDEEEMMELGFRFTPCNPFFFSSP